MPTWEEFKQKHVLNPNRERGYESWDRREQNRWLKNRLSQFNGNPRQSYGRKNMNSVIIATSEEILEDFRNPGMKYEKEQDFFWSNQRYPIWLFKKRGSGQSSRGGNENSEDEQYSVTDLHERHGPMHFLARTDTRDQFKPIHFHGQAPNPSPNSFPRY